MPEYGEYHTTDPEIEKTTSQIRKKIHQTIQEIIYQGQSLDNIEAFLVNNKDMDKIHQLFNGDHGVPGGPEEGQMKMYGVKIIESQYVPEGTIFKVFKNQDQFFNTNIPISGAIDVSTHNGSGVIPGWNQPMPPGVEAPPIPDYAYQYEPDDKEDEKETEPVEERHSTKRRIELEE